MGEEKSNNGREKKKRTRKGKINKSKKQGLTERRSKKFGFSCWKIKN
jgi:hypothetical protein